MPEGCGMKRGGQFMEHLVSTSHVPGAVLGGTERSIEKMEQ